MCGTRRATRLFQEHKGILKEAGYAALNVCHHGDDIIAEGEPDKLDRLDEVFKQLVVVVLDRVGPRAAEHGQRSRIRVAGRSEASRSDHQKPFQGEREATEFPKLAIQEALDELEEVEGKLCQQDTDISIYVSSARLDIQFCVKRLSEMMTKPRKLGKLRLARLARYLVGTEKLVLRFDHEEYGDTMRIAVDSDWAGSEERSSTHAGLEFHKRTSR